MEKAILGIVIIVAVVGLVGILSSVPLKQIVQGQDAFTDGGITGNVVADEELQSVDCSSCAGYAPVCAQLNNRYITYNNACEAACASARVVADQSCSSLPIKN